MKTPLQRAATLVEQQYKRNPEAVQLAKLASLAVRAESHLLRRLRLELLPDADVGIEADLWFGPLVESRGVRAIVLNRYVVELLRDKLAEDREQLQRVIALTEQAHAESASTIRLEERLNALAVLNQPNVQQQIDEALRPALRTMQLGGDDARQLAQWAMRALSQAHRSVRESPNAIALGLSATLVLGGRPIVQEVPKLTGDFSDMTWLLRGAISGSPARIGVELVAGGVAFAEAGGAQPQLDLPATNPLLLSLTWKAADGNTTMLVDATPGRTAELSAGVTEVSLRTLTGDEYRLSAVTTVESPAETTSDDPVPRHFDIDVYISYVRLDNRSRLDQKGWVTTFHEDLRQLLRRRMRREVKTWMDQRLQPVDEVFNDVVAQFSNTAVMVSVLSPGYLNSEWCMKELNEFCRVAEQTGGVVVDDRPRVFKVLFEPIDPESMGRMPPGVRNPLGYEFFEFNTLDGRIQRYDPTFGQESKEKFIRKISDLADDIARILPTLSAAPQPETPARKHSRILVSYQREDSAGHAGRLFDKLIEQFGEDRVLMDIDFVESGEDVTKLVEDIIDSCDVLIAVIGKQWRSERLNDPNDRVRLEIARALRRDIPVIPVLVQGASMPWAETLPRDLETLVQRNAIELSDRHWRDDVNRLISAIERILTERKKAVQQGSGVPALDRAIESFEQQLAIAREGGDRRSESIALHELGAAYDQIGESRRAIEFFEQALHINREIGDRSGEGNALRSLGRGYAHLRENRHAIQFFEQAMAIYREIRDPRGESTTLGNMGTAYAELGETRHAIQFFEQALGINREIGYRGGEGIMLRKLGTAYIDLSEAREAIKVFEQALVVDREIDDRRSEGIDLSNMSTALAQIGQHSEAIKYAEQALTILEELEDPRAENVRAQLTALHQQTET